MNFLDDTRAGGASCLAALTLMLLLACMPLSGCATVAPDRDTADIDRTLAARGLPAPAWKSAASRPEPVAMTGEITLARALLLAFERNPDIRRQYAQLGLSQADVVEASRLGGLSFGYSKLSGGGERQITRSLSLPFTDLLLLPLQGRLAGDAFAATRDRVAAALVELGADVETAWYEYVSARQIAEMRALVARAAETSAEYAGRLRQAGNISPRNHALELAAASEMRIASARAAADAARARAALANLLAIHVQDDWQVPALLPAVPTAAPSFAELEATALANRLDLRAAREAARVAERTLSLLRRWRWLGVIEVGGERESAAGSPTVSGPTFGWEVPLFHWNKGGILRQAAALEGAQAELASLEFSIRNELSLALNELATARDIAESYRTQMLPQRDAVLDTTLEEFNYMITDAFDLLEAKREQFEAYGEYLEAVRDYWVARARLRRIAGGDLPGEPIERPGAIGVDPGAVAPEPEPELESRPEDHSGHQGHTP